MDARATHIFCYYLGRWYTSRSVTDRLKISRKLAYIVDSTAAPVATVALVTTWIGYQLGVGDAMTRILTSTSATAFSSAPSSTAPFLAISSYW